MGGQPQRVRRRPVTARSVPAKRRIQQEVPSGILDAAGLGVVYFDTKGRILGANGPFRAMLGYAQRELIAKRLPDLVFPEDPDIRRHLLPKALLGQLGQVFCHWRHKKGRLIPSQSTFGPFQHSVRGQAISQVLVQNVSELRQQGSTLKESLAIINKLERLCHLGTWTMELRFKRALHRNLITVSDGLRRILQQGAPEAESPGILFFKQLHPEDLPAVVEALQRAVGSSEPEVVEARIRLGGQEERVLEIHAEIRKGTAGQPALVGSVQDITERKRTQIALARAKEFFEAVVDAMPVNLAILDGAANIVSVNTTWRKFALANGYPGERLGLGVNYLELCESYSARTEVEAQIVARALRQMLNGRKEGVTLEYPCHSSREQRWFMLRLTPFTFGGELRIVAAHLNVTRLKRTEKSLEEAREMLLAHASELERRIDKRTMELKETIRSLEGVLYHVAHDLRAPLRAMEGFTTLLLGGYADQFDPAARDYADRIAVSAKRMDVLIGDLLNFGKVCVVNLPHAFLNLGRIIDRVLKRHWQRIETSGAEIEVFRPMPKVWANEWAVGEAFYQLISNALKFAHPGIPPRVRIWSEVVGTSVRIWVQDNGTGIPREYAERVFRMFERLDEGTGSTGIGLAIVRKAVERMDGRVGLESAPGEGARFWLELPANPLTA